MFYINFILLVLISFILYLYIISVKSSRNFPKKTEALKVPLRFSFEFAGFILVESVQIGHNLPQLGADIHHQEAVFVPLQQFPTWPGMS